MQITRSDQGRCGLEAAAENQALPRASCECENLREKNNRKIKNAESGIEIKIANLSGLEQCVKSLFKLFRSLKMALIQEVRVRKQKVTLDCGDQSEDGREAAAKVVQMSLGKLLVQKGGNIKERRNVFYSDPTFLIRIGEISR